MRGQKHVAASTGRPLRPRLQSGPLPHLRPATLECPGPPRHHARWTWRVVDYALRRRPGRPQRRTFREGLAQRPYPRTARRDPADPGGDEAISRNMLDTDPPDHERLRALVSKAFTPRLIERMRPRVQAIADGLLDAVQDKGEMDLIDDYAFPLPITVIAELLG